MSYICGYFIIITLGVYVHAGDIKCENATRIFCTDSQLSVIIYKLGNVYINSGKCKKKKAKNETVKISEKLQYRKYNSDSLITYLRNRCWVVIRPNTYF